MNLRDKNKDVFLNFLETYSKNKQPIQVNFRELVREINTQDRATHSIHTYPAKLLRKIPFFFINNNFFTSINDSILDPFCGSGTVLLESILSNMQPYGSDANPLARLISEVKTNNYNMKILEKITKIIQKDLIKNDSIDRHYPDVLNLDYWFLPQIKNQLNLILHSINKIESKKYKKFFLLCFSNCIKKVSLADPRVSVPVRLKISHFPVGHPLRLKNELHLKNLETINVYEKFLKIVDINIGRFQKKQILTSNKIRGKIISEDARKLKLKNNSIDLIITSPPYAGAQKYIRASSLSLGWTELSNSINLKELDKKNIGRENYLKNEYISLSKTGIKDADSLLEKIFKIKPQRAHIAANYLNEMRQALKESIRVLKPNKYLILVAANNKVCGFEFETQEYLRQIAEGYGMKIICRLIDDIKSYGLMTKRNKTASIITCEWVLILKKSYEKT